MYESLKFRKSRFAALCSAVVLTLAASSCATNPAATAAKGKKALDAGRYAEAEIDYMKAVQQDPQLADAWYGLGLAQLKSRKLSDAYNTLTRAHEMTSSRDDIAASLGDVCVAGYLVEPARPVELYQTALSMSSELLKRNPDSFDGLRLEAYIAMIDRHYPDAVELLKKAESVKPGEGEITQALIESLIKSGRGPEAEKLGTDFLRNRKDFAPVYDTLYSYYMDTHREGVAENLLKDKVAESRNVLRYRLQLAAHYLNAGKSAEMTAVLQQVIDEPSRFPDGRLAAGNFCIDHNRLSEALAYFQAGAAQDKDKKLVYQQRAAETLISMRQPDKALDMVNEILKTDPVNADARAARVAIGLDSRAPDGVETALLELPQLIKQRPTDPLLHYNLGRAQLSKGNTDGALSEFQEAIRENPRFVPAKILAADISMQREDYAQANRYGNDIVRLTGGQPGARLLRVQALTGMGNFEEATRQANQLAQQFPAELEPKLQLAALKLAQKRYSEAESQYRAIFASNPKDLRSVQGLIDTFTAQNRFDAAIQFLTEQKQKSPSPRLEAMLADTALRGNKLDLAIQEYGHMAGANPGSPFEHLRLGDAYLRKGDMEHAVAQFQTARSIAPKDALANAMLALALHDAGRSDEAQKAYREALALQSGNPAVSNNLAYLMADTGGNLDEALRLAQDALRQQPSNLAYADTVGLIYLKKNLLDGAIQIFTNTSQKEPRQPLFRFHLAMALQLKGDKKGAKRECEAALADHPAKNDEEKIRGLLSRLS